MKAYKIELLVVDFAEQGQAEVKELIENTEWPNGCLMVEAMQITEKEIGEWGDEHPLNSRNTNRAEYKRLFGE